MDDYRDIDMNTTCPFCGEHNDAVSAADKSNAVPKADDFTLCIICGEWAVYADVGTPTLGLRKPDDDEYQMLVSNEEFTLARKAWVKMEEDRKRKQAIADAAAKAKAAISIASPKFTASEVKHAEVRPAPKTMDDLGLGTGNMVDELFDDIAASMSKRLGTPTPDVMLQVKTIFALGAWSAIDQISAAKAMQDPIKAGMRGAKYRRDLLDFFRRHPALGKEFKIGDDK